MNFITPVWMALVLAVGAHGVTETWAQSGTAASTAQQPQPLPNLSLRDLRMIPMQSGGRLKPFDEFSRELLLAFTGNRSFGGFDPSELIISMMVQPGEWAAMPIIRVGNEETRKQLLLDPNRKFFSPNELGQNNAFLQYAQSIASGDASSQVTAGGVSPVTAAMDPRAEELKRVVDRMSRFQALVGGQLWMTTPSRTDPQAAWEPLAAGMQNPSPQSDAVYALLKSYLDKDVEGFQQKAAAARQLIESATPDFENEKNKLVAEVYYNRLRPFFQSLWLYLLAGVLWIFAADRLEKRLSIPRLIAKSLTFTALFLHVFGFALRCYVAGRPPVTNMYESIIWVSFGVMVFALLIYKKTENTNLRRVLMSTSTILAGLSLYAADAAPLLMDPTIRPLVPVLRSNYWLTIHVLTITASYAAFMLAMGISNITLFQYLRSGGSLTDRISMLNLLNYRALIFGTVLLAAGTILGGIWADYSWGRFWGWDPKEVWALIALLAYMAVLHGRYSGWVGPFGFALWTTLCFSTVIMAWYGVNFVLGVGLHSYGFSSGGQSVMAAFVLAQIAFCLYVVAKVKVKKESKNPDGAEARTSTNL